MKERRSHQQISGHVTQSGAEKGNALLYHCCTTLVAEQAPNITPACSFALSGVDAWAALASA